MITPEPVACCGPALGCLNPGPKKSSSGLEGPLLDLVFIVVLICTTAGVATSATDTKLTLGTSVNFSANVNLAFSCWANPCVGTSSLNIPFTPKATTPPRKAMPKTTNTFLIFILLSIYY